MEEQTRLWNDQLCELEWIMWRTAPASLTLPERLDSSSPPMILTLPFWSFYKKQKLRQCLTHPRLLPVNKKGGQAYTVALYSNEIHRQRDWFVAVLVQGFNIVQEVRKELVAPFKHAESNDVVPPHVLDYISSQSLSPEPMTQRRREKRRRVEDNRAHVNAVQHRLEPCFDHRLHAAQHL